jgi:hypothetical protein
MLLVVAELLSASQPLCTITHAAEHEGPVSELTAQHTGVKNESSHLHAVPTLPAGGVDRRLEIPNS